MNTRYFSALVQKSLTLCGLTLAFSVTAQDFAVNGNLDVNGNTASFGTSGANPGYNVIYTDGTTATIDFMASSAATNWFWRQGTNVVQMQLTPRSALQLVNPATGNSAIRLNPSGNGSGAGDYDITSRIFVGEAFRMTEGANRLYVSNAGVHGPSWTSDLGITYAISDSATSGPKKPGLILYNDDTTAGGWSPLLLFSKAESGSSPYKATMAGLAARSPTGTGTGGNWIDGELWFYTAGVNTSGLTPRMLIDSEGRIGIGTTTLSERLEVAGNIKLTGNILGSTGVPLLRNSASGSILGGSAVTDQVNVLNTGQIGVGITPVAGAGKIQLAVGTTAADGILFGTDTNLYRKQGATLHTDALLSTGKGLIADATFTWSGTAPALPNGVSQQVTYIDMGNTSFWGWLEVTLSSSYDGQQATGKLTKRFDVGRNVGDAGQFLGAAEMVAAHGPIATQWKIGDPQIFEGRLRIPLYHLVSTSNPLFVQIQGMRPPDVWGMTTATFLSTITLTAPTTLANTQTRDYPYTISERSGFGAPPTAGRIQLAAGTTEAGGIYWGSDTNLYRSAANTLKTDDTVVVMDKVAIGTTITPTEKLEVVGNIKLTGSIITPTATLTLPAFTSGSLLTTAAAQTITGANTFTGPTTLAATTLGGTTAATQVNVVAATGNVGIGTTSAPTEKLEVVGNTKITGTVQIGGNVTVKNNAVIRVSPAGDIEMGLFTTGTNPGL